MGGSSSGRYRTRNRGAVEHTLRLNMSDLKRLGFLRPGARMSGAVKWNRNGRQTAAINLAMNLTAPDAGFAELTFTVDGESRMQRIAIDADPCRFGGRRFYFICPRTAVRCSVLCCVGGVFASRQFHRLSYASQSEDELGRLYRVRSKAEARALGKDGHPRPRSANRARLVAKWIDAETAADDLFATEAMRRFGYMF